MHLFSIARLIFALALTLVGACADPPAPVAIEPALPDVAPPPPPTLPPTDGLPVITMGTPTFVAEAPIVTQAVTPTGSPALRGASLGRPPGPAPRSNGLRATGPVEPSLANPPPGVPTVQSVIRAHFNEIEGCYAPVGLKNPSVAGRITVQWTLGSDGTPTAVAIVGDTMGSPAVTDCIRVRARSWRFPAPTGGVAVVRYPFDLKVQ